MSNHAHSRGGAELADGVRALYREGQTDYGLEPLVLADAHERAVGRIGNGDAVVFCCRRGEREIQLTEAFVQDDVPGFSRNKLNDLTFVILTLYHEKFKDLPVAFAPTQVKQTLAETISRAGLRQLHVAESEKFAHVTFFLNGGRNQPFEGEEDLRLPSPKGIPPEQNPALSLPAVADAVLKGIDQHTDFIVTNFANGDVIGHTSNREAKIKCAEIVDRHLGELVEAALREDHVIMVTADHGNLETLFDEQGAAHVAHTTNPVEFILIDPKSMLRATLMDGNLCDIAPTVLSALGVHQPELMDGKTLAPGYAWEGRRRVILVILDGWGIGKNDESNPIFLGQTPVWDDLLRQYPHCQLMASGEAVGLEAGKPGNSEAGHMNMGAGRVVMQDDLRLDQAMKDGSFFTNAVLCGAIDGVKQHHRHLHLIALLTEKSSHGSIAYPLALLKMAKERGLDKAFVHVIFDGRSTEPGSAPALLEKLEMLMDEIGLGQVVTGVGRGIALDRDGNYQKTQQAYEALVNGTGRKVILKGEPA